MSSAICSLPANDPLTRALVVASRSAGQPLGSVLERALGVPAALAFATPRDLQPATTNVTTAGAATAGGVVAGTPAGASGSEASLLSARLATLEALHTTWHRAQAACANRVPQPKDGSSKGVASSAGGANEDAAAAHANNRELPPSPMPPPPTAIAKSDDAFSVFDF